MTPLESKILKKRSEVSASYTETISALMSETKIEDRVKLATLESLRVERAKMMEAYNTALRVIAEVSK